MGLPENITPQDIRNKMIPFIEQLHRETELRNQEIFGSPTQIEVTDDELAILEFLAKLPFYTRTEIKNTFKGMSYDKVIQSLQKKGLVTHKELSPKTKPANYYPLTEKAQDFLNIPPNRRVSEKMFVHSLWIFWVYRWADKQGFDPVKEFGSEGINGRIDVFCRKTGIAYEITRSFKNLCDNAHKCLLEFQANKLVVVCGKAPDCKKAEEILSKCLTEEELRKVSVQPTADFI